MYKTLKEHWGHNVIISSYCKGLNYALECEDCNEILFDCDEEGFGED